MIKTFESAEETRRKGQRREARASKQSMSFHFGSTVSSLLGPVYKNCVKASRKAVVTGGTILALEILATPTKKTMGCVTGPLGWRASSGGEFRLSAPHFGERAWPKLQQWISEGAMNTAFMSLLLECQPITGPRRCRVSRPPLQRLFIWARCRATGTGRVRSGKTCSRAHELAPKALLALIGLHAGARAFPRPGFLRDGCTARELPWSIRIGASCRGAQNRRVAYSRWYALE